MVQGEIEQNILSSVSGDWKFTLCKGNVSILACASVFALSLILVTNCTLQGPGLALSATHDSWHLIDEEST